jgi:hypothetical protein
VGRGASHHNQRPSTRSAGYGSGENRNRPDRATSSMMAGPSRLDKSANRLNPVRLDHAADYYSSSSPYPETSQKCLAFGAPPEGSGAD